MSPTAGGPNHALVPGKPFACPHCGEDSIVRKKTLFDGWKATGEILVCSLCGKQVGSKSADSAQGVARAADEKLKKAEALLGSRLEPKKTLDRKGIERFCKNCKHYLIHPFQSRCLLWNRPVEPMADCPKLELKTAKKESTSGTPGAKPVSG